MQYRAMRYVSWKHELCDRKKKHRRRGSRQVRAEESRHVEKEIKEEINDSGHDPDTYPAKSTE